MKALLVPKGPHQLEVGEWCYWEGDVYACCPGDIIANLTAHECKIEDGELTVSPSIEVRGAPHEYWHGYIEKGIWLDVNKVPLP